MDKLAHIAINKLAVKLVENYDFSEKDSTSKLTLEKYTFSFGVSNIKDTNAKCTGFIVKVPETKKYNEISIYIKGVVESNINTVDIPIWLVLHEVQDDGTVKEICESRVVK